MSILKSTNSGIFIQLTDNDLIANDFKLYVNTTFQSYHLKEFPDSDKFRYYSIRKEVFKNNITYSAYIYYDDEYKIDFNDFWSLELLIHCWRLEYEEYCKSKFMYKKFKTYRNPTPEMIDAKNKLIEHIKKVKTN